MKQSVKNETNYNSMDNTVADTANMVSKKVVNSFKDIDYESTGLEITILEKYNDELNTTFWEKDNIKRDCVKRSFAPMGSGSLRGTTLRLIASMIGVGFLAQPTVGKANGWLSIVILVVLAQLFSMIGNFFLVKAYRATCGKCKDYPSIVEEILGKKSSVFIVVIILLHILSASTSYYSFTYLFTRSLVFDTFGWLQGEKSETIFKWTFIFAIYLIQLCGCLPKKITALSYFTLITNFIIFYIACAIIADFFIQREAYIVQEHAEVKIFELNSKITIGYGLALFSAVNQFATCNIVGDMEKPSTRRLNKVITPSFIFPCLIYVLVGVVGYLTYGNQVSDIVINRKPQGYAADIHMIIARILLILTLIVGIVIRTCTNAQNLADLRKKIRMIKVDLQLSKDKNNQELKDFKKSIVTEEPSDKFRIISRAIISFIPAFMAILLSSDIIRFISIAVGFLVPSFLTIVPSIMYIKIYQQNILKISKWTVVLAWFMMIVVGGGSYACVFINVLS